MGISTQPIYLEFTNMEDLKISLLTMIHKRLVKLYYSNQLTENPLLNFGLNVIALSTKERKLFMHLYLDNHGYGKILKQLSYDLIEQQYSALGDGLRLSKEVLEESHEKVWISAVGLAVLLSTDTIDLAQDELIQVLNEAVQGEAALEI